MIINKTLKFTDGKQLSGTYQSPEECPLCFRGIDASAIGSETYVNNKGERYFCVTFICKVCDKPFVAYYSIKDMGISFGATLLTIGPKGFSGRVFREEIKRVSTGFVNVYNQSLQAESMGLDEIAGVGYRRAVEFLVKDYLVDQNPTDAEKIKGMDLSKAINQYVKDEKIRSNVLQAYWLGHDYTHYVKKYTEADITDLKDFIDAAVYWVGMELITAKRIKKNQSKSESDSQPTQ